MCTNYRSWKYKIVALIVAAGVGSRCNNLIPKQYITLIGKPILFHTIKKFLINQYINYVRVVINKNHENFYKLVSSSWLAENNINTKLLSPTYGGTSRQNSVKLGLESLKTINPDFVVIHDACRPFVSNDLINNLAHSMIDGQYSGVVPAIEIEDTISLKNDNFIKSTILREKLISIQTPQIFNFKELCLCHQSTKEFTDDSSLMVDSKKHIAIIKGEKSNFKITTKEDINISNFFSEEPKYRIGTGYDIHKFSKSNDSRNKGGFIKICGIKIKHSMLIKAHSNGDVAIHAVVDAIFGALGCGDIGEYFPPNSDKWKNYSSSYFLSFANTKIKLNGYCISNLDITIICEEPKISPYKAEMKKSISKILEIESKRINIKATTAEKLGSIGRNEGITAYASVLLYKRATLL